MYSKEIHWISCQSDRRAANSVSVVTLVNLYAIEDITTSVADPGFTWGRRPHKNLYVKTKEWAPTRVGGNLGYTNEHVYIFKVIKS